MIPSEFYTNICNLNKANANRDLQEYLLALYNLVHQEQHTTTSANHLLGLLEKAYTATPAPFEKDWLSITKAPDENIMSKKFTNPVLGAIDKTVVADNFGFEYTVAVIKFQIAELYKMRDKQLKDEYRYFGIDSETGNRWYNFDTHAILKCGARGLEDNADDENIAMDVTWQNLGELLEMGRIYE